MPYRLVLATPAERCSCSLGLNELCVLGVCDEGTVDAEWGQVHDVRRPLVVVRPCVVRAHREWPAPNEDVAARRNPREPIGSGQVPEGERLRHRFDVLELM